jgi:rubrerythrin
MANIAPMAARSAAYRGTVPWERTSMAITLAQAIRNAIAAEQAAEKFYLSMAGSAGDEEVRRVLVGVAAQEREHATRLEVMGTALVQGDLPERADALVCKEVKESQPPSCWWVMLTQATIPTLGFVPRAM